MGILSLERQKESDSQENIQHLILFDLQMAQDIQS